MNQTGLTVVIRPARPEDARTLYAIFLAAVREGAARHYSLAQRLAWALHDDMPAGWPAKLASMTTIVAETETGLIGFMSVTDAGHIDLAFLRPEAMGQGVAQAIYDALLAQVEARGVACLTTHASHLARSFFSRNGWRIDSRETITRGGKTLTRFAMSLGLPRYQ